eukprot:1473834-Pleurochrysis_carterae.AAC.2
MHQISLKKSFRLFDDAHCPRPRPSHALRRQTQYPAATTLHHAGLNYGLKYHFKRCYAARKWLEQYNPNVGACGCLPILLPIYAQHSRRLKSASEHTRAWYTSHGISAQLSR